MRALAKRFCEAGIPFHVVAKAVDRDRRALGKTFEAEKPRFDSVRRLVVVGLRLPPIVARALFDHLEVKDAPECRIRVVHAINQPLRIGTPMVGALNVAAYYGHWLERQEASVTLEAGRACILATAELDDALDGGPSNDPALGRVLGAMERVFVKYGFSLRDWIVSDARRNGNVTEGWAAYYWLCEALGLAEADQVVVMRALKPYLDAGPPPTEPYVPSGEASGTPSDYFTWSDADAPSEILSERFARGSTAAQQAFRLAYFNPDFDILKGRTP
jgi:hypothetical protein